MAEASAEHWYPTAAYLYTLHLDGPALAWEYLRRNPDYRRDWLRRRRRPDAVGPPALISRQEGVEACSRCFLCWA